MAPTESSDLRRLVEHVARQMVARYNWHYVKLGRLVDHTLALQQVGVTYDLKLITQITRRAAGEILHQALTSADDEIATLVLRDVESVLRRFSDPLPDQDDENDAQQEALIAISANYASAKAGSFLSWATTILRHKRLDVVRSKKHSIDVDSPAGSLGISAVSEQEFWRKDNRKVDPEGDEEFMRLLHDCLENDDQRLIAYFVLINGLKRRHFALLFDMPLWKFDRLLKEVTIRLKDCAGLRELLRPGSGGAR